MYIFNIFTALCILKISSESLLADTAPLPYYIKKKKLQLHVQVNLKKTKKKKHKNIASHWVHRIHKLK